jgi:hypothetical protein
MAGLCRHWRRALGVLVLAAALAACETTPSAPLLSPLGVAKYYGYGETPLGEDRYEVSFVGPTRRSTRAEATRQQVAAEQRTQAYDFAVWRAAQLALAGGFTGFSVSNVRTHLDSHADDLDPFWGQGFYGPGPFSYRYPWGPYWGPPYWGPSPYEYLRTDAAIEVRLLHALQPGDYDAHDVVEQLRQTYPGAEGAPPAAASPAKS